MHLTLSIVPGLFLSFTLWRLFAYDSVMNPERISDIVQFDKLLSIGRFIFYFNQLVFAIVLLVRNWRLRPAKSEEL